MKIFERLQNVKKIQCSVYVYRLGRVRRGRLSDSSAQDQSGWIGRRLLYLGRCMIWHCRRLSDLVGSGWRRVTKQRVFDRPNCQLCKDNDKERRWQDCCFSQKTVSSRPIFGNGRTDGEEWLVVFVSRETCRDTTLNDEPNKRISFHGSIQSSSLSNRSLLTYPKSWGERRLTATRPTARPQSVILAGTDWISQQSQTGLTTAKVMIHFQIKKKGEKGWVSKILQEETDMYTMASV